MLRETYTAILDQFENRRASGALPDFDQLADLFGCAPVAPGPFSDSSLQFTHSVLLSRQESEGITRNSCIHIPTDHPALRHKKSPPPEAGYAKAVLQVRTTLLLPLCMFHDRAHGAQRHCKLTTPSAPAAGSDARTLHGKQNWWKSTGRHEK